MAVISTALFTEHILTDNENNITEIQQIYFSTETLTENKANLSYGNLTEVTNLHIIDRKC